MHLHCRRVASLWSDIAHFNNILTVLLKENRVEEAMSFHIFFLFSNTEIKKSPIQQHAREVMSDSPEDIELCFQASESHS